MSKAEAARARFSTEAANWDANPGHIKSSQDALAAIRKHVPQLHGEGVKGKQGKLIQL